MPGAIVSSCEILVVRCACAMDSLVARAIRFGWDSSERTKPIAEATALSLERTIQARVLRGNRRSDQPVAFRGGSSGVGAGD
jgi:hypothetical protein